MCRDHAGDCGWESRQVFGGYRRGMEVGDVQALDTAAQ